MTVPAHFSAEQPIRVYLLDDHELVRRGLRDLLDDEDDIVVVGESGLASDAVDQIPGLRPDVAILDGRLPDGSGVDVCRDVRSLDPRIKVLILTSYDDDDALFAAILAGASGYVLKVVDGGDLLKAVRLVAGGRSMLDPAVTEQVLARIRTTAAVVPTTPDDGDGTSALTTQELRILDLIGKGRTNRQIAQEMSLSERTIKNYVSSVLAKLGVGSRTQAAIYAMRRDIG